MPKIDRNELLDGWASSAARMDEFAIVSDIREAAAAGAGAHDMDAERARAAILARRPALAAGLLADVERSVLTATSHSWRDVIAMAAWAALGDADALSALHRAGQNVDGPAMVVHRYLLASAADQAGRSKLADSVWQDLAEATEPTMLVTRRKVVADVIRRSTSDSNAAGAVIGRSARALIELPPLPEDDLRHVRDVVTQLEARGDHAGALLILEAIAAVRPVAKEARPLLKERARGGGWWRERVFGLAAVVGATALAIVCTLTGLSAWVSLAGALAALAVWRECRLPQGEGLSPVDARVLAEVRALLPDVAGSLPDLVRRIGGVITGGTLAFLAAAALATLVTEVLIVDVYRANAETSDAIVWLLILMLTVIGGVAGPHLLRVAQRPAARKYVDQMRSAHFQPIRGCACLSTVGIRGADAKRYASRHLREAEPEVVAMVPAIARATVKAHQCPESQTPWLSVRLPGREALIFRGTLVRVADEQGDTVGGYL